MEGFTPASFFFGKSQISAIILTFVDRSSLRFKFYMAIKTFSELRSARRDWFSGVDEDLIYVEIGTKEFQAFVDAIVADALDPNGRRAA